MRYSVFLCLFFLLAASCAVKPGAAGESDDLEDPGTLFQVPFPVDRSASIQSDYIVDGKDANQKDINAQVDGTSLRINPTASEAHAARTDESSSALKAAPAATKEIVRRRTRRRSSPAVSAYARAPGPFIVPKTRIAYGSGLPIEPIPVSRIQSVSQRGAMTN